MEFLGVVATSKRHALPERKGTANLTIAFRSVLILEDPQHRMETV